MERILCELDILRGIGVVWFGFMDGVSGKIIYKKGFCRYRCW